MNVPYTTMQGMHMSCLHITSHYKVCTGPVKFSITIQSTKYAKLGPTSQHNICTGPVYTQHHNIMYGQTLDIHNHDTILLKTNVIFHIEGHMTFKA